MKTDSHTAIRWEARIALLSLVAITMHLAIRFGTDVRVVALGIPSAEVPLLLCLAGGGIPLLLGLFRKAIRFEFGSDQLAGISIVTSVLLGEYLAGSLVVLMLSGGEALEAFALRSASSVLEALAKRVPTHAHRKDEKGVSDVALDKITIGETLLVLPHEICPVDGTVLEGRGAMDESFLTGEPYRMSKTPGTPVISGAINGSTALTIRAEKLAEDSRYARIMRVMKDSEQSRPRLRRLGDQLGALYTPFAILLALIAWVLSGESRRFLAVLVVATPCPLLIGIPVAIIGAISLAAQRGIIIKDPAALETVGNCRTAIFDKTGTLTYGRPVLTDVVPVNGTDPNEVLTLVASVEQYSKHPLAGAVLEAAQAAGLTLREASQIQEPPGAGVTGIVGSQKMEITGRSQCVARFPQFERELPEIASGLECIVLIDDEYRALMRFRDQPRREGAQFVRHLGTRHHFRRTMLVTGDRETEARYLADLVGITEVLSSQTPEQKLAIVRRETEAAKTVFMGDGINDAPALAAATVGIAFGQNSDITSEAAGVVIMDSSLQKVDELLHIGRRLRSIALQSAVGGMALSVIGMTFAAAGYLPPVAGAILQEIIDLLAVTNALRMSFPPGALTDYELPDDAALGR